MEPFGATSIFLVICLICLVVAWSRKPIGRLPPGPSGLPVLGNILQLNSKNLPSSLIELSEKYGPVFTIHLGSDPVVVLCSHDAVKEALIDQGDEFSARGRMPLLEKTNRGHGVIFSNGERWKQLRRFSLMTLRNFGLGKRSIEERIQEEAQFLIEELRKTQRQPFEPTSFLSRAVSNVICSVVFGKRFDYQDKNFLSLLTLINELFLVFSSIWTQIYNYFPSVMEYMPGPHQRFIKNIAELKDFIREKVKMNRETLDPNCPRDFIDCFLIKMDQEKHNPASEFHIEALTTTTFDLFSAGTETVSTTMRYGLLLLLKYSDIQEKVHKEIDSIIGQNRAPSINDRSSMPYTDAVIHEIQRFADLIPMSLPHAVTRDVILRNYVIPKGTTVFPVLSAVLHGEKHFKNAYTFNPEHFLDENGCFKKSDAFMPFSTGKRICLGEGLARMEIFLFLTTILQNFNLKHPSNQKDIDVTPKLSGFGNVPPTYQLCLVPRERS